MDPAISPTPLRVAFDAGPLHGHRTGIGMMVAELGAALGERSDVDVQPYLISGRADPHPGERRLPLPGIVASHLWSRSSYPRADRWLGAVDVVHGGNFVAPPSRFPTVVTVHDCWFLDHPDLANPVVSRVGRWLQRNVDEGAWVHTPSHAAAADARRLLGSDRVVVVHSGPPPNPSTAPSPPPGVSNVTPIIVAVGTEERRKGYPDLVRAFRLVAAERDDVGLVIAGASGDDSDHLTEIIEQLPMHIRSRITRLGIITDAEKAWLLAEAEILAYPSLDEGFGFPLLEANQARLPIVARDAGAIGEIAGTSALLVDAADGRFCADYAEALVSVLTDDELKSRLVDDGIANLDRFSWKTCAAGLHQLYQSILE